jgi:hypothetical protein
MSREWAIIANNVVANTIVADADFLESHPDWNQFEKIDITDLEIKPGIAWTIEDGKFKKPAELLPEDPQYINHDEWLEIEVPN